MERHQGLIETQGDDEDCKGLLKFYLLGYCSSIGAFIYHWSVRHLSYRKPTNDLYFFIYRRLDPCRRTRFVVAKKS